MAEKVIAIIPARGGSKRCPKKNIALFKGKPLISHTIEQALESGIFNNILVSSDDSQAIKIASSYEIMIDERDSSLATDNCPLIDVLRSLIKKYNFENNCIIGLLLVTGPLRTTEDIRNSCHLFSSSDRKASVVSVTANENPIEMSWRIKDGHLQPYLPDLQIKTTRKQDFDISYRYNDAVIFDLAANFMDPERNLFGKMPVPYLMPPERSINIDYEFQLKIVQMIGNIS